MLNSFGITASFSHNTTFNNIQSYNNSSVGVVLRSTTNNLLYNIQSYNNATCGIEVYGDTNFYSYDNICLLYTSPSPRDRTRSRMPSSA